MPDLEVDVGVDTSDTVYVTLDLVFADDWKIKQAKIVFLKIGMQLFLILYFHALLLCLIFFSEYLHKVFLLSQ